MYYRFIAITLLSPLLLACEPLEAPPTSRYRPVLDIHHTMELILDPAADTIWDSAGFVITEDGEQDLSPNTDEEWHRVEAAAAVVTEAGNLLMMPGRSAGADWNDYANGLINSGQRAMAAALEQDAQALFDAGGDIYRVCKACHDQYWIEVEHTPQ